MVFDDISYLQQNPLFLDSQSFSFPFHYQEFLQKPGKLGFDPELATGDLRHTAFELPL